MSQKYLIAIVLLLMILFSGCIGQSSPPPIADKNPIRNTWNNIINSNFFHSSSSVTPTPVSVKSPTPTPVSVKSPTPTPESVKTLSWLSYSDNRFNAQYPQNWTYTKNGWGLSDWDDVAFYSPNKSVYVLIYSGKKDTSRTLDTFHSDALLGWQKDKDNKLISTEKITLNGAPAYKTIRTWTGSENQQEKTMAINTRIGTREYTIYYTSSITNYDTFLATAQKIIDNIRIIRIESQSTTVPSTIKTPITTQVSRSSGGNNNAVIEYPGPVKIVNPLDLKVGDIIQRSTSDSRYDIDHAYRVENIFPQTNEFLIKEIIWFKTDNQWITMGSETGRIITSGALMRDYPNLIGHASGPLPQKCMICRLGPMTQCSKDDLIFTDC